MGLISTLTLACLATWFTPPLDWHLGWNRLLALAVSFWVVGFAIRVWAIWHLRGNFSADLKIPKELITSGPYGLIRHPCYLGTLFVGAGFGVLTDNWLGITIMMLGVYTIVHIRMIAEERLLLRQIGSAYAFYLECVPKRLIPFIY